MSSRSFHGSGASPVAAQTIWAAPWVEYPPALVTVPWLRRLVRPRRNGPHRGEAGPAGQASADDHADPVGGPEREPPAPRVVQLAQVAGRELDAAVGPVVVDLRVLPPADLVAPAVGALPGAGALLDRKSTRLNSSHMSISYAVF